MNDYVIRGARVVDGTGGPSYVGDVAIKDGRIVESDGANARSTFDADGLVVTPGFIDPHTHYDAQLFWDPQVSPSNVHGVTTVLGGNCGFTLAPVRDSDADYLRRMMEKVEGMPLAALEQGVDWKWESYADYLNAVEQHGVAVNAGFLVGHCALRRYVMGADAIGGKPTEQQMAEMVRLLHEALDAGGLGFSTTRGTHTDGDGQPVASRHADLDELLALCTATGEHEGTTLEGIVEGCLNQFSEQEIELMTAMSVAARRPLNWNVLTPDARNPDKTEHQLSASDYARERGGRIIALTMPVLVPMNMSFRTYCAFNLIPGWGEILSLPIPDRIEKLRDPTTRKQMLERGRSKEAGVLRRLTDFGRYVLGDTYAPENNNLSGRVVADIASERGGDPFDVLLDIVISDDLRTVLWPMPPDNDEATWELRKKLWDDPRVMLGGSDAGAHLDRMCGAPYTTRFIGDMVRGRQLVSLERAVQMITGDPAQLFGLRGRGHIQPGYYADLVVFDPERVGSQDARLAHDLPGGSARLTAGSQGVVRVLVNGVETVIDGAPTGSTPGTLLRSGRDTETVSTG